VLSSHWRYGKYVAKHKWYVFLACCRLGIPWAGIVHDLSKFRPSEWRPYAEYFYGHFRRMGLSPSVKEQHDFDYAWLLHQKANKHHWQWWILHEDSGELKLLPMPDRYRREMLADWKGAGRAAGKPDTRAWYLKNREHILLEFGTRYWIEQQLGVA